MRNTLRCCISCILPCGFLDVIRVVHLNGRVEEFTTSVKAGDVMRANPKHVLRRRTSDDGVVHRIVVLPADAELQRGKIYFLVPVRTSSTPEPKSGSASHHHHHRKKKQEFSTVSSKPNPSKSQQLVSDRYLSDILSENAGMSGDQRRGRVGVWRPRLTSISELPSDS
ncbi:hypothetical protein EJ110_NYTH16082 [Nymphaea thermarum]|nr:hypothetical protein EJ110_NYTH16082 [Nymphaea thermarum]